MPEEYIDRKEARRMARFSQLALAAAREALEQARFDDRRATDPYRVGVIFGNGMGGYPDTDKAVKDIVAKGGSRMDPFYMVKMLPNMAAAQVAMRYGAKGYNATISTACASAGNAMGEALEMIRDGRADVMITGGTEAGLSELGLAAFQVMKALSTNNDPPRGREPPLRREARRLRLVRGRRRCSSSRRWSTRRRAARRSSPSSRATAARRDAHHVVVPVEDGEATAACMTMALEDAGVTPEDVDYVNAHGTSTQMNDKYETIAMKRALGEVAYQIPISSTKSLIGHTLGASAAIESVACVQSILHRLGAPDDQPGVPGPRLRPRLRAEQGAPGRRRERRAEEQLRLRRPERLPRFGSSRTRRLALVVGGGPSLVAAGGVGCRPRPKSRPSLARQEAPAGCARSAVKPARLLARRAAVAEHVASRCRRHSAHSPSVDQSA